MHRVVSIIFAHFVATLVGPNFTSRTNNFQFNVIFIAYLLPKA